jgi:hypothetical protein
MSERHSHRAKHGPLAAVGLVLAACSHGSPTPPVPTGTSSASAAVVAAGPGASSSAVAASGPPAAEPCQPDATEPLVRRVEQKRYEQDLAFVAREPRPPGSAHWQAVQDLLQHRLGELGFAVQLRPYATGMNVVGRLPGTSAPNEQVLVSAHYDHIPGCRGADDNASGVAGALETARVLATAHFSRTLVVAFWDEEERGLVGSAAYAAAAADYGDKIVISYVYEMIGFRSRVPGSQRLPAGFELLFPEQIAKVKAREARGDFVFVVADEAARVPAECLETQATALGLPIVRLELSALRKRAEIFGQLQRSDHASFWDRDVPSMMISDTADFRNSHYHCGAGPDVPSDLDPEFAARIIQATVGSAASALGLR